MKQYIGTKILEAEQAFRFRGKVYGIEDNAPVHLFEEYPEEVERGYRLRYPDGYISWSPQEVFEEAYRRTDGMNFGLALEAVKKGKRVARAGWNGKGMYIFLADVNDFHTAADISEFEDQDVGCPDVLAIRTAQRELQVGWLASQADMLADDWYIVE